MAKKSIFTGVENQMEVYAKEGRLALPVNYSPENAMKSAWLILQQAKVKKNGEFFPMLSVVTQNSVANALLYMVVNGLSPAKNQCYFIAYADVLNCQRGYLGSMSTARRVNESITEINADVVYRGDKFSYKIKNGKKSVANHEQTFESMDSGDVTGAYCVILDKEENVIACDIMTFDQIKKAWAMSKAYPIDKNGNLKRDSTHSKHIHEMCKKTVINRVCKHVINSSDDSNLIMLHERIAEESTQDAKLTEQIQENSGAVEIDATPPAEVVDQETGEIHEGQEAAEFAEDFKTKINREDPTVFSQVGAPASVNPAKPPF
jgi:recombination protein RecT